MKLGTTMITPYSEGSKDSEWLGINTPVNFTFLMDPRANAHVTCGLLPTKSISIPTVHYLKAMNHLGMWFPISPILQSSDYINKNLSLNLPKIAGYEWTWWDAFHGKRTVDEDDKTLTLDHQYQLIEGWLQLTPLNK